MRILKVMISGLTILGLIYLATVGFTRTGDDDLVSIGDENLSKLVANASFDSLMQQPMPYPNPNNYFLVYEGENYSGPSHRVYVATEDTHYLSFWDEDAIRRIDKWTGYPPKSHLKYVKIKSIKLRVYRYVTLFEGENYTGYCLKITKDTPSFRQYVLQDIKSLFVGKDCPQNLSTRRFNIFINNNSVFRIRYRLKINGTWEPAFTIVRSKKSATRGVDSNQIVSIEVESLDLAVWKKLCSYDLDWKRNNTVTVKSKGLHKIWCEKN